ncbi:MAG: hypothetical protein JNL43_08385 [Flavobacteriales bacterium]|nr:hypothetical protein [Flavobacteriales bacterium]
MRPSRPVQALLFLFTCTLQPGCRHAHPADDGALASSPSPVQASATFQPGDLLFQDLDCGPLCDAIEAVTEGYGGRDFSHVGMVVRMADTLAVIEAIGADVHLTSLTTFQRRSSKVLARHVKPAHRALADRAAAHALAFIGTPYDDAFLPDNGKLYCSELIAMAYEHANSGDPVFTSAPMTFKDPRTGAFFPAWVAYYAELDMPIPEGKAGCNPGGLSRNEVLFGD